MEEEEPNNFGWLGGVGYFNNVNTQEQGIELIGGMRYKKVYLLGSAQTNATIGAKLLLEF